MVSEPAPTPAKGATPEREWSADEVARGLALFKRGTSIRKLSATLGVSRHQAERFIRECREAIAALEKPAEPTPEPPRSPFAAARRFGASDDDGAPPAPFAYTRRPEPEPLEDLLRTRQLLKANLDKALSQGDSRAVSSYSLALNRLQDTQDPGAAFAGASNIQFSGISDAVLELLILATRACRERLPAEDGNTRDPLTSTEQAHFTLWSAAIDAVAVRLKQPIKPGATIAIKFEAP
jgi:hypothetical protein